MGGTTTLTIACPTDTLPPEGMVDTVVRLASLIPSVGIDAVMGQGLAPLTERIFLHPDEAPRRGLLDRGRRDRKLADLLVERVFPDVSRRLESGWISDRLSFVEVTIAATRLQDAVRTLGRQGLPARDAASLMLIVPEWEQHGLPAAYAADRLRRMGAPTRLMSGMGIAGLIAMAQRTGPQALLISVGSYRSLARVAPLVEALRRGVSRPLPIVLGGPGMGTEDDVRRRTGADLATSDLSEALRFCDFTLPDRDAAAQIVDA